MYSVNREMIQKDSQQRLANSDREQANSDREQRLTIAIPDREEPDAEGPPPAMLACLPAPATALPDQQKQQQEVQRQQMKQLRLPSQGVKRPNEDVVSDRVTRTRREAEGEAGAQAEDQAQQESMLVLEDANRALEEAAQKQRDSTDAMKQAAAEELEVIKAKGRVEQAKVNARAKLEQATRDAASAALAQAAAEQEQRDQQNAEAARLLQATQDAEVFKQQEDVAKLHDADQETQSALAKDKEAKDEEAKDQEAKDQEVKDKEAKDLKAKEDADAGGASGDEDSRGALALAQAAAEFGDAVPSATASDTPTCGLCLQVLDHTNQELEALGCSHVYHTECLDDLVEHTPNATRQNCCPLKCNRTPDDEPHVDVEETIAATLLEIATQPPQSVVVELADID